MGTGGKSHFEQIWSALPQTADIDRGREDFSVGPIPDSCTLKQDIGALVLVLATAGAC
jgi:hypothetical protein